MSSSTQYQQFSAPGSPGRPTQPRRMTASSGRVPPPAMPLGLPEPTSNVRRDSRPRSRSPLRRSHSFDGDDNSEEEDHFVDAMSSSARGDNSSYPTPAGSTNTPAIAKVASAFLRVGSLVGSSIHSSTSESQFPPHRSATSPYPQSSSSVLSRLTDAELEAEALREKENSRLEAERILLQEAEDRRRADERVLSRMRTNNGHLEAPSSPSHSPNEVSDFAPVTPKKEDGGGGSWMSGLMKKLTPTKDKDLTPAQQIINETKAREKREEKERKSAEKQRSGDWPAASKAKLSDPAYLSLHQPNHQSTVTTPSTSPAGSRLAPSNYSNGPSPMMRGQMSSGPSTPTPASRVHGPPGGSPIIGASPGGEKEPTPLYAVFNQAGTLDIPATLITVTRRFEKLEKWTVSHVRALEDRMKDVEKYLIERESGEQKSSDVALRAELSVLTTEIARVHILLDDLRSDMPRYQSKTQTTASNQTAAPAQNKAEPQTKAEETFIKSPSPIVPTPASRLPEPGSTTKAAGARSLPQLPQPTGQSAFSSRPTAPATNEPISSPNAAPPVPPPPPPPPPPAPRTPPATVRSPPSTPKSPPPQQVLVNKSSRTRLPYPSGDYTSGSSRPGSPDAMSGLGSPPRFSEAGMSAHSPRSGSESSYVIPERYRSPSPPPQLAPPKTPNNARAMSASPSPTPRKRYTVALSGRDDGGGSGFPSPNTATRAEGEIQTALFSGLDSPTGTESRAQSPETETFESGYAAFGGLFGAGGRTGHGRDTSDATAVPPDREGNKSPDPTIGLTPITLTRLASPPPTSPKASAGTGLGVSPNGARSRPSSTYSIHSLSPSLKSVQNTTNTQVVQNDGGSRVVSSRARAQSTYNDSPQASVSSLQSATSNGSPRPSHRRSQSIAPGSGRNGDNNGEVNSTQSNSYQSNASSSKRGSTLQTPSGQPFVDPLIIKKKSKDPMRVANPNGLRGPNGAKVPFGQLVAFFDGGEKAA